MWWGKLAFTTFALLLAVSMFTGCDENPVSEENYSPEPVLFSFIQTGAPIDTVTLQWTGSFEQRWVSEQQGIEGAEITLFPIMDGDGNAIDTSANPSLVLRFHEAPNLLGYGKYVADNNNYRPVGTWTYRIEASKPSEGLDLWAETTAPDTFSFSTTLNRPPFEPVDVDGDTMTRRDPEVIVRWSESKDVGGFVMGIVAETPEDGLVLLDPEDPDEIEPEDRTRHAWTFTRYDQQEMIIPWVFFTWAGPNRLYVDAASESYYDYMFSLIMSNDPSWNENPQFNVQGGLGVFGAYARIQFSLYMEIVQL